MKKFIVLIICVLVLCGCATGQSNIGNASTATSTVTDAPQESNDWHIYTSESGTRYTAEKLPYSCPYNDKEFSLKRMEYYTDKIGKSYVLFAIMVLDIKQIPSDELDWFIEDTHDDIFTGIYLTNDDNDFDFDKMTPIGMFHYTDAKELLFIYMTPMRSKENRYAFDACHFSATVSAKQKEKFEYTTTDGTTTKLHKSNEIIYFDDITKDNTRSLDSANKSLKDFIVKQVNSLGDTYAGLVGNH